jgi:sensor domain CHASE-containing protein
MSTKYEKITLIVASQIYTSDGKGKWKNDSALNYIVDVIEDSYILGDVQILESDAENYKIVKE